MQVACFCCFRQGVARMSRDLGWNVPDLEKNFMQENFGLICRSLIKNPMVPLYLKLLPN